MQTFSTVAHLHSNKKINLSSIIENFIRNIKSESMRNLQNIKKEIEFLRKMVDSSEMDPKLSDEFILLLNEVIEELIGLKKDIIYNDESVRDADKDKVVSKIKVLKRENEGAKNKFDAISKEIKEIEEILKKNELI